MFNHDTESSLSRRCISITRDFGPSFYIPKPPRRAKRHGTQRYWASLTRYGSVVNVASVVVAVLFDASFDSRTK